MSIIQQALEKMSQNQEVKKPVKKVVSKPWLRQPMGSDLEQELMKIQQDYVDRRNLRKKIVIGALIFIVLSVMVFWFGRQTAHPRSMPGSNKGSTQVRVIFGGIYRLSGITKFGQEFKAVINDEVFGAGEQISESIFVKEVERKKVILNARGKEIPIRL